MTINRIITLDNGKKIVEFKLDYEYAVYDFINNKYVSDSMFRLDKHNLLIRINNLKKQNIDTSVEEQALFMLDK